MGRLLSLLLENALPLLVAVIGVWIAFSIVMWATGRDTLLDLSPAGAPVGLGDGKPVDESAIAAVRFDTGLRGYRTTQVDAALTRLAWEIGRKDEQLAVLRARLQEAGMDAGTGGAEGLPADADARPEEAADESAESLAAAGREAGREDSGEAASRGEA